jgi:cytochrome c556
MTSPRFDSARRLAADADALCRYLRDTRPFDAEHAFTALQAIANSLANYAHKRVQEQEFSNRDLD